MSKPLRIGGTFSRPIAEIFPDGTLVVTGYGTPQIRVPLDMVSGVVVGKKNGAKATLTLVGHGTALGTVEGGLGQTEKAAAWIRGHMYARQQQLAAWRAEVERHRAAQLAAATQAARYGPLPCAHCGAPNQPWGAPCSYCQSTERKFPGR